MQVKPLKSRTLPLDELQMKTLDLIRKLRLQLIAAPWETGMNDQEFLDQIVKPLEDKIHADRELLK